MNSSESDYDSGVVTVNKIMELHVQNIVNNFISSETIILSRSRLHEFVTSKG